MEEYVLSPGQYASLWRGAQVTLAVLGYSFLLGVGLSLLFGVMRLSEKPWIRGLAFAYVELARGISSIILLFVMAIAMPILLGIGQGSLVVLASIALGLNMGGYGAEIVRGAILAVPKGQTEASIALNLTPNQRLRHVVLPQALRVILPPFGNLSIEILKGTALVSLIGMADIMQVTRNITQQQLSQGVVGITALYVNVLLIYFVFAQIINGAFRLGERQLERQYRTRGELPDADDHALTAGAGN